MKEGFRRDFISARTFCAVFDIFWKGNTALLVADTVRASPYFCTNSSFPRYITEASLLIQGVVHNHQYENEITLLLTGIAFSCERLITETRFENEARGNS